MKEVEDPEQGRKLLTAVERILADTDSLVLMAKQELAKARDKKLPSEDAVREDASLAVVRHFSNRSALSGGLAALPALVPGAGTLVAALGGTLADMCFMLKFEVEMALVLSHLHGFDITREDERQLAFLLASVSTYDAKKDRNAVLDLAETQGVAFWKYAPREASKMLVSVMTKLALLSVSKGLLRALPLVGIAVGSSMNKVLTQRVGDRCVRELKKRRELAPPGETNTSHSVVDAHVRKSG
ncbi:EcsC family protein [Myxococcus sp. K38C18041901]|uniref:EcsC family protein n=1 Tax=Myxococcus guangdongensis TaxID=2906760 RepID=UPI0020A727D2|nr:EcsC family protein [Myxococcus guangdongensis]MCP3057887.1 EcsC family protein [Myxococcus guangdongensis]